MITDLVAVFVVYLAYCVVVGVLLIAALAVYLELDSRRDTDEPPCDCPAWVDPRHIHDMRDLLIAHGVTELAAKSKERVG